ncbi:cation:proton antiporter family protein [Vibrio salinus]|uniref:cation:proton antiporter family protein n=1 Tax=Vibrio salinus TaxID=2899784 RepID=UPI001E5FD569|nr:cation:proton antiporter family protein [Vibrio salinus]MCE0492985.1 cation:proton antiporter [Vibrio salinus]
MDLIVLSAAFLAGYAALKVKLPPLVGFLAAGFILHLYGFRPTEATSTLSDLGVTLLLFTIGLKLDVKTLLSKEVWLGATVHNLLSTAAFSLLLVMLKNLGIASFAGMSLGSLAIIGFALSFSSTVFAVKTLQEKGEFNATYGNLTIGILVMQDIFAVLFLTASTGKIPEWYAVALFILPFIRPLFYKLLDHAGHGEMLVLSGMFFALVTGAGLFHLVGLKPDLGAIILGMLLAGHRKASELSKSLLNLKELFLVCFFLNIGLDAEPTLAGILLAFILILLLPVKALLYYQVINRFHFRVRTTFLATLTLLNFSEFGLIVGGLAYRSGWINSDLLVALAVAVPLSFLISVPLNKFSNTLYFNNRKFLKEVSMEELHSKDQLISPGQSQILVLGMGRIGAGAYDEFERQYGPICLGVELVEESVKHHQAKGRNVIRGDATDSDFWSRIVDTGQVSLILLSMPHHQANQIALEQLKSQGFKGKIAAIANYPDQIDTLLASGAHAAFNVYSEAGSGFARHVCHELDPSFHPAD